MKKIKFLGVLLASTIIVSSCGDAKKEESSTTVVESKDSTVIEKEEFTQFEFDKMMANFPKPMEIESEIVKAGIKFDKISINSIDNLGNYQTEAKKALNFGTYAVDLGYLAAFDKKQEALKYFKNTRQLAVDLNAVESFDKVAGANIENQLANKDTLVRIADDVYYDSYTYIKSSNKLEVASLIVAGSWIESQYHALSALKSYPRNAKTEKLYNKIYEQQTHLSNLLNVLTQFEGKEEFDTLITDYSKLLEMYKSVKETKELTQEVAAKFHKEIEAVRAKIIK
jgi:hypothetical protein